MNSALSEQVGPRLVNLANRVNAPPKKRLSCTAEIDAFICSTEQEEAKSAFSQWEKNIRAGSRTDLLQ